MNSGLSVVKAWWRRFRHPEWTPARLRVAKRGAYFVGSAEGTRSSKAIRKLGPEEHQRQIDAMVEAIREGNRRGQ